MKSNRILSETIRIFYPERCLFCGDIVAGKNDLGVCPACLGKDQPLSGLRCKMCGIPIVSQHSGQCADCERTAHFTVGGSALWTYDEPWCNTVLDLKFKNRLENVKKIAVRGAKEIKESGLIDDIDIIVPVPLHKAKKKARGFNQADLLADALGKLLERPVEKGALIRIRNTEPQMKLNLEQRKKNLQDAIRCSAEKRVHGKKILLLDDVYTSGATINECAKVLMEEGGAAVYSYCICVVSHGQRDKQN